jgi:4-amino-4-deoxy-L-arabinose transferase-like glycosyltransferase
MSPKTRNPQKQNIRDLQKLYTFYFAAALGVCGFLPALLVAAFSSIIQANTEIGLLIAMPVLILFLPVSIFMEFSHKTHKLKFPTFIPEKILKIFRNSAMLLFWVGSTRIATF